MTWNGLRGDRNDINLQKSGDELITKVADGCGGGQGSTIVVVHAVGPVVMEKWISHPNIKAVIMASLPGQESGNAITDILLGVVNPSGKLPYTIGKSLDDYGPGAKVMYYPNGAIPQQTYSEGLYIDYRYFDKNGIEPRYEFGYGLSYTTFEYSDLVITPILPKSPLPAPRADTGVKAPSYSSEIPNPSEALAPTGFTKLAKFVYPYITSISDIKKGAYPYPSGYDTVQMPSQAGGDEGGNPDLWLTYVNVSLSVKNTGSIAGKEVVQVYVSYEDVQGDAKNVDFPVKVLRQFEKIFIEGGKSEIVSFNLTRRDLSYWDIVRQNWVMPSEGKITIRVGSSSRDLRLTGLF